MSSKLFRSKLLMQSNGRSSFAKIPLPAGAFPISRQLKTKVELMGKKFLARGWSFKTQAGVLIPMKLVKEMGLRHGQPLILKVTSK